MSLSEKYIHSKLYIVLFLFILIGCGQPDLLDAGSSLELQSQPTSTFTSTPTLHPINVTKTAVMQRDRDSDATAQAVYETAQALPETPTLIVLPTSDATPVPIYRGIERDCETMYTLRYHDFSNCWTGEDNGVFMYLIAGSPTNTPNDALIGIYTYDRVAYEESDFVVYRPPQATNALTITEVTVPYAYLVAENGDHYIFNVITRTWEAGPLTSTLTRTPVASQIISVVQPHPTTSSHNKAGSTDWPNPLICRKLLTMQAC